MQAFSEAVDGIRTHDLLHGKQSVRSPGVPGKSWKRAVSELLVAGDASQLLPRNRRGFRTETGLGPCGFGRRLRSRTVGAHPATRSRFAVGEGAAAAARHEQQPARRIGSLQTPACRLYEEGPHVNWPSVSSLSSSRVSGRGAALMSLWPPRA